MHNIIPCKRIYAGVPKIFILQVISICLFSLLAVVTCHCKSSNLRLGKIESQNKQLQNFLFCLRQTRRFLHAFWRGKKYVRHILKQVRHILKYKAHIFPLLRAGSNPPSQKGFRKASVFVFPWHVLRTRRYGRRFATPSGDENHTFTCQMMTNILEKQRSCIISLYSGLRECSEMCILFLREL